MDIYDIIQVNMWNKNHHKTSMWIKKTKKFMKIESLNLGGFFVDLWS